MLVAVADTHAVLWYLSADPRLSLNAKNLFTKTAQQGDNIGISAITLVEMVYLVERGRISPQEFTQLAQLISQSSGLLVELPIDIKISRTLSSVNVQQVPDMPDRIIATTAVVYGVPLISRDAKIRASSVMTIW